MAITLTRPLKALSLALAFTIAAPVAAQDGGKALSCMRDGYTAEQTSLLAELGPQARFEDGTGDDVMNQLAFIAMGMTQDCSERLGWTDEQGLYASFYELGRVVERGYRQSGEISKDDLDAIDAALAQGDRSRFWEAIERSLMAGMVGGDATPTPADAMALGTFLLGTGIEVNEEKSVKVGLLLGFMALQRYGAREFLALES